VSELACGFLKKDNVECDWLCHNRSVSDVRRITKNAVEDTFPLVIISAVNLNSKCSVDSACYLKKPSGCETQR
jgi:hypothetical protein